MESKITRIKNFDEVKNNSVNVETGASSFINPIGNICNNGQLFSFGNNTKDANTNESSTNVLKLNTTIKDSKEEKTIETKLQSVSSEESQESTDTLAGTSGFKFGDFKPTNEASLTSKKPTKTLKMTANTKPPFSFGSTSPSFSFKPAEQNDTKPFFSFGSKTPTISPITLPVTNLKPNDEAEDEDQPPVVNFTPIKENDAVFESKSKLFCFKNGKYEELGVGQLYLKPIDDTKIQLIMRNDSALGTIMANTLLNESVNFTKRNAKNVQLTCVLDPTKSTKPQTILFKFKDSQITDSFENELAKLKK